MHVRSWSKAELAQRVPTLIPAHSQKESSNKEIDTGAPQSK